MSTDMIDSFAAIGVMVVGLVILAILILIIAFAVVLVRDKLEDRRIKRHIEKVVYCSDCKHYNDLRSLRCSKGLEVDVDGFCYMGERPDEG